MKFSFACLTAVLVPVATLANEDQPHLVASSIAINDTNMNIPKGDIRSSSFSKVKETSVYKKLSYASDLRSEPTKLQNNKAGVDVNVNAIADVDLDNHSKVNKEEAVGITVPGAVLAAVATTADSGEEECVPPVTVTNTIKLDTGNLPLSSCSSKKQICLYSIDKKKSSTPSSIKKTTGYCVDDTDVPSSYWVVVDPNYTDVLDTYHEDHTFTSIATIPSTKKENDNMNVQDQVHYSYVTDDHRHLQYNDCSVCNYRPQITVSGSAFKALINDCINNYGDCQETLSFPTTQIGCWDVSTVNNMDEAFSNQKDFNSPLGCWNTESVTSMDEMFTFALDFNQNINTWNTGSVTSMIGMFYYSYRFNQCLSAWAGKTTALARTENMFEYSSCPYDNTEFDVGPWCQGPAQGCNAPSSSPSVEPSEEPRRQCSSIGGGCNNYASGTGSTVSGGEANKASGEYSSIGGGFENVAKGTSSVVIGGSSNQAIGAYSIAMGKSAIAKGDRSLVINLGKKAATSKKVGEFLVKSKAFSVSSKLFSIRIGKEKVTINKNNINNFKDLLNDDSRRLKQIDGQQAINKELHKLINEQDKQIDGQQAINKELHKLINEQDKQNKELHRMMTNFITHNQKEYKY